MFEKTIKATFFIICTIGCFYQLISVCSQYFKFATICQLEIVRNFKTHPRITYQFKIDLFLENVSSSIFSSQTYENILFMNDLINENAFIYVKHKKTKKSEMIQLKNVTQSRIRFDTSSVFITLIQEIDDDYEINYDYFSNLPIFLRVKYLSNKLIEKNKKISSLTIIIHNEEIIDPDQYYSIHNWAGAVANQVIYFEVKYFSLLSYPYDTDCHDYSKDGYHSRSHCINKCLFDMTRKKCNKFPKIILDIDHFISFNQSVIDNKCRYDNYIENLCYKRCSKTDCDFVVYSNLRISLLNHERKNLMFAIPFGHNIYIKYSPKISLTDTIVYCGSLLGFWFGTSFISYFTQYITIYINYNFYSLPFFGNYRRNARRKLKRKAGILKTLVQLFAIIGFSIQAYIVLQDFCKYETNVDISLKGEENEILPAISVKYSVNSILNKTKTCKEFDRKGKCTVNYYIKNDYSNVETTNFLFEKLVSIRSLIKNCSVIEIQRNISIDCFNITKPKLSIVSNEAFLTLFVNPVIFKNKTHNYKFLSTIRAKFNPTSIHLHNHQISPTKLKSDSLEMPYLFYTHSHYTFTYEKVEITRLEHPFTDNCRDYTKEKHFHSRQECLNYCLQTKSIQICKKHLIETMSTVGNNYSITTSKSPCVQKLIPICEGKCNQDDCIDIHYNVKLIDKINTEGYWTDVNLELHPPESFTFKYGSMEKTNIIDLIVYLFGSLAMWFGVSLNSIFPVIMNIKLFLKWMKKRRMSMVNKFLEISNLYAFFLSKRKCLYFSITKYISILVCLAGLFYDTNKIITNYISYPTNALASTDFSEFAILPRITLLVEPKKYSLSLYPDLRKVSGIHFDYSKNWPKNLNKNCQKIEYNQSNSSLLITFLARETKLYYDQNINQTKSHDGCYFIVDDKNSLYLNIDIPERSTFKYSLIFSMPGGPLERRSLFEIDLSMHKIYLISFSTIVLKQMPKPYSNCSDNAVGCARKCNGDNKCISHCYRNLCLIYYFTPFISKTIYLNDNNIINKKDFSYCKLSFSAPSKKLFYTVLIKNKYITIDLIVYLANSVSFWFGLSVISVFQMLDINK